MSVKDLQHLETLHRKKVRRLHILEERAAYDGRNTPPEILMEIEDLGKEVADLEEQIINSKNRPSKWSWLPANLRHNLGVEFEDKAWGVSIPSRQDYLIFGQYVSLYPGTYRATFQLKIDDNKSDLDQDDDVATIDVASNFGNKFIAVRVIKRSDFLSPDTYQSFTIDFTIYSDENMVECRVFFTNRANLVVKSIDLERM